LVFQIGFGLERLEDPKFGGKFLRDRSHLAADARAAMEDRDSIGGVAEISEVGHGFIPWDRFTTRKARILGNERNELFKD
jgi:hypothetical protein